MKKGKDGFYCRYVKRVLDIICALLAMVVFCWLYALVAILVRVKLGTPIIFQQQRPGKNERIFTMYKYRTMTDECDETGKLLPDEMRLTKFGKFLRSTSLDELPEAWNILRGDMSVVGPRPLLIKYLPYYSDFERHRHDLRPGLTGLAQVSGRSSIDWDTRLELDSRYVQTVSLLQDCTIVFRTVGKVLLKKDIIEAAYNPILDFDYERRMACEDNKVTTE